VHLPANAQTGQLHWKYWQERADWAGPRSFVLADGEHVVAHGGVIPGRIAWGDERTNVIHVIDWAARPQVPGAGLSVMRHIGRFADALIAIGGGPQTRRLLPHLGFQPCGEATGYVRTLRPLRLLTASTRVSWRVVPRFARSVLWCLTAPGDGTDGWQVRRLEPHEVQRLAPVFPVPKPDTAVLERSAGLLRHMLVCPIVPMELYALERQGRTRGYFLMAFAPAQARLVDCWIDSDDPQDWRALIQCAVRQAMHTAEVAEIVTWASDSALSRTLLGCGFHARNTQPVQTLGRNARAMPQANLRVQMLDRDAPYLDLVRSSLWA